MINCVLHKETYCKIICSISCNCRCRLYNMVVILCSTFCNGCINVYLTNNDHQITTRYLRWSNNSRYRSIGIRLDCYYHYFQSINQHSSANTTPLSCSDWVQIFNFPYDLHSSRDIAITVGGTGYNYRLYKHIIHHRLF